MTPRVLGPNLCLHPLTRDGTEPLARLGLGQAASWACALPEDQEKRQSSLLGDYQCGQAPGLETKRVFLSDALPNTYISPEFCFLSWRSRGNRNKDSISLQAGRQLLEVFTALPQCGRGAGHPGAPEAGEKPPRTRNSDLSPIWGHFFRNWCE